MIFKDLREFIDFLEDRGELKRVKVEVSTELEITELADRMVKSGGPALLFENVEGSEVPVVINLYGTHRRMAWALGVENLEELTEKVRHLIGMLQSPPGGVLDKVKALGDLWNLSNAQPKIVSNAPCQDNPTD